MKCRAATGIVLRPDAPVMGGNDGLRDRQPEPHAFDARGEERLEQTPQVAGRDAAAAILHRDVDAAIAIDSVRTDRRRDPSGDILHRVHSIDDQVQQDLLQLRPVADHQRKPGGKVGPDLHMPLPRIAGDEAEHVRHRGIDIAAAASPGSACAGNRECGR